MAWVVIDGKTNRKVGDDGAKLMSGGRGGGVMIHSEKNTPTNMHYNGDVGRLHISQVARRQKERLLVFRIKEQGNCHVAWGR